MHILRDLQDLQWTNIISSGIFDVIRDKPLIIDNFQKEVDVSVLRSESPRFVELDWIPAQLYNEKNIITLIEAKTAYNDVAKADIQPQLLVGIKSQSGDLYYLSNIHREINNNFTNWYIIAFFTNDFYFS